MADGFIERSSDEQAEANEHVARTPTGAVDPTAAQALTGHTTEQEVVTDEDGSVVAAHTTTVITDPQAPNAVQVPDPDVYPTANATQANARGVDAEPTPNEQAEDDADAPADEPADD